MGQQQVIIYGDMQRIEMKLSNDHVLIDIMYQQKMNFLKHCMVDGQMYIEMVLRFEQQSRDILLKIFYYL